jgi:Flp pilus assembly CpaE family ATPase
VKLAVLSAADGAGWEERLVTAFEDGAHQVAIVRRCVDIVDLLAVAASGQGRVALVAAGLRRLDAAAVERLSAAGVVAVGVVRRDVQEDEDALRRCGVTHLVADDAQPAVVASVLLEAIRTAAADQESDHAGSQVERSPSAGEAASADSRVARQGTVLAVWGPTGAPGRSTVAVALADELAGLGCHSLLVDADVYGGTVAPLVGLLDESPGIAAACRQAAAGRLDPVALAALCWQLNPRLRVLTGIPLASRWLELRPAAIEPLLAAARAIADVTVIDCGFSLETDEELSFDTVAPQRNGATLAVLGAADLVIVVGGADPIGIQRLIRAIDELREAGVSTPNEIVLNRVRDAAIPGDPGQELAGALARFAGRTPVALLPADQRALDAAVAGGRLLSEASPSSPLRRAVRELAAGLIGVAATRRHRAPRGDRTARRRL